MAAGRGRATAARRHADGGRLRRRDFPSLRPAPVALGAGAARSQDRRRHARRCCRDRRQRRILPSTRATPARGASRSCRRRWTCAAMPCEVRRAQTRGSRSVGSARRRQRTIWRKSLRRCSAASIGRCSVRLHRLPGASRSRSSIRSARMVGSDRSVRSRVVRLRADAVARRTVRTGQMRLQTDSVHGVRCAGDCVAGRGESTDRHPANGFLASTPDEWFAALQTLRADEIAARRMGAEDANS